MNSEKSKVTIVTHNGQFHTDDVFGVATVCLLLEKNNPTVEIEVVRSRDKEKFNTADYVLDTGDIYDPKNNRFDHHQVGGAGVRENGIPYASFGLVWKKFGTEICGSQDVADAVENKLVLPIDARDNGVNIVIPANPSVIPYEVRDLTEAFRTTWKDDEGQVDKNFIFIMHFAKEVIQREIKRFTDMNEARSIVLDMYNNTEDKRLLIFDRFYPYDYFAKEMPELLFVVYPSLSSDTWSVDTVSDVRLSYIQRKNFPNTWAGKNNEELEKVTGVSGSIFCHNNRFLAVAKTKEGAIELAKIALQEAGN